MEDNTEFAMQDTEPTDKNAATRNVDDRSTRTQQTSIAVDSPDLASSQTPLELLEGSRNGDVEQIGPSSKKKKKKKKKTEPADGAISSTVDGAVQNSTPSSSVYSDRESSVSTTTVKEAGQQSTDLPTTIESENEDSTQCSNLPKKKKKNKKKRKKKKAETTDSNLQGDDSNNGHFISSDAATAIPMDAPVLADDGNEELRDELQNDDAVTERIDNQEDSVMRKEISTTLTPSEVRRSEVPNEMGSLETNSSAENLDEIQEERKRSAAISKSEKSRESKVPHAPEGKPIASLAGVTASDGINTNPLENREAAEKEEPDHESYNDNNSSDLLGDREG